MELLERFTEETGSNIYIASNLGFRNLVRGVGSSRSQDHRRIGLTMLCNEDLPNWTSSRLFSLHEVINF